MFSRRLNDIRHTLAFRLTLWYAGLFTVSSCVAFLFFYLLITSVIRERIDQDLGEQVTAFSKVLTVQGPEAVKQVAILEARAAGVKKIFFRLLYPNGVVFSSSNMSYWQDIKVGREAIRRLIDRHRPVFETIVIDRRGETVRILYDFLGPGMILQLGQSMEHYARFIEAFRKIFVATMAALFVLAGLIGWFMARRALSGVAAVTRTAAQIAGGALDRRVPVGGDGDEIDQLASTFNHMLDRIERLIGEIREMNDNIAHDLRSPITRIRGLAEVTLTTGASGAEFEQLAASTIEECDRLLDMINTMLDISRVEAGLDEMRPMPVDLTGVVVGAHELFGPSAEDRGLELVLQPHGPLFVDGDRRRLQRMIANVVDNAIKYTPAGGRVEMALAAPEPGWTQVAISDSGAGISARDLPRIFDRFYRCDQSRSAAGTGLGLSLARAIARSHGGDITVRSRPGAGSTFIVSLPRSTSAPQ